MNPSNDNISEKKKILIMGLDQAGKTCIAKCLRGVRNLSAFNISKPTMGFNTVNFHALGSEFVILDFGGQEAYREDHLKNFDLYIKNTNKIIYVIDIQDVDRYQIAVEYLKKTIDLVPSTEKSLIEFSVFLHKCDSDRDIEFGDANEITIFKLIEKIKAIFPPGLKYKIHKTSIYTVFQKSSII